MSWTESDLQILEGIFEASGREAFRGQPMQFTDTGIWLPCPLRILSVAVQNIRQLDLTERFGPNPRILDAGMGDGRVLAFLAWALRSAEFVPILVGIEFSPNLYALAEKNLTQIAARVAAGDQWAITRGDYLEAKPYDTLGTRWSALNMIFNYPDGHEHDLARAVADKSPPGTLLCFLTPDMGLGVEELELETSFDIVPARGNDKPEPAWQLLVYRR